MDVSTKHYVSNLVRLLRGDRLLEPLVVSYCVTTYCNLNCVYCEDFGARRNASAPVQPLPLLEAKRLLAIIRQASDSLIVTGGEPLLYADLSALVAHARNDLRFHSLTLLSNATLLPEYTEILHQLDRLVISLDTIDPQVWNQTLRAEPGTAQKILATLAATADHKPRRLQLIVHCVVTPETLSQAQGVLDFCIKHDILFSCSPQSVNNWPRYELMVSDDYAAFIERLMAWKQRGAPILGSLAYLQMMLNLQPYPCYPLLVPRVMPDGALSFPCRPIERSGHAHGGRAINLLEIGNWREAVRRAVEMYGSPPLTCGSCYQQCYVEPSLMQAQPLALLRELTLAPSRRARVHTYAPG